MTILRKRIIFQHKDYPRGKTLPNLYAKFLFRVSVLPFYQNTRRVRSVDSKEIGLFRKASQVLENLGSILNVVVTSASWLLSTFIFFAH